MRTLQGPLAATLTGLFAISVVPDVSGQSPSASSATDGLAGTTWVLETIDDQPVELLHNVTLGFGSGEASGYGGCDRYVGEYTTDGSSMLRFGHLAETTAWSCHFGDGTQDWFERVLAGVTGYAIDLERLTLVGPQGDRLMTLRRMIPSGDLVGAWDVTLVNDGHDRLEPVPEGAHVTIAFGADGTVGGFDGCADFLGGYRVDNDTFATGDMRHGCDDENNTDAARFRDALRFVAIWLPTAPGALELRDSRYVPQIEGTRRLRPGPSQSAAP
jgi:heat shock protein HslJ